MQASGDCGSKPRRLAVGIAPLGIVSIGIVPMGVLIAGVNVMGVWWVGLEGMGPCRPWPTGGGCSWVESVCLSQPSRGAAESQRAGLHGCARDGQVVDALQPPTQVVMARSGI